AGDRRDAVAQFSESLRLRPDPSSHYNLGSALLRVGEWNEAAAHFEQALTLNSDYALAHQGLAVALANRGRREEAIAQLREALRLAPALEDAHYNLGVLLAADGQPGPAAASFKRALDLHKDWPAASAELAWVLSTSSDPAVRNASEALSKAERAVALTAGRDARALDALAASLAAAERFDEAVRAGERALKIIGSTGDRATTDAIRARLELYKNGMPYLDRR